jgi:undecaprenyl-diphosphatase
MGEVVSLDRQLMLLLNFDGGKRTDTFWYTFSDGRIWFPLLAVCLYMQFKSCQGIVRHQLLFLMIFLLLLVVSDQLSSDVIKPLAGRLRPSHDPATDHLLHDVNDYHGGLHGFVSGHATNTVTITTWPWLIFRNKPTRARMAVFALLTCYSRIYLGVHYPGDIICGAIHGFVLAYLTLRLTGKYFTVSTQKRPDLIRITLFITLSLILIYSTFKTFMV